MSVKKPTTVAYYRTSSAANVGADNDSKRRRAEAVEGYAKGRYQLVEAFYDAAVSGADPVDTRPCFAALLAYCEGHSMSMVLVENASRFARDLAVQLTGHALLRARGIELVPPRAQIPKTGKRRSLRAIAEELAALGHVGPTGVAYHPGSIRHMLGQPA